MTTAQKMKLSIKGLFSKCDQIYLLNNFLMEKFTFCPVDVLYT